jgi:hypothetical protein
MKPLIEWNQYTTTTLQDGTQYTSNSHTVIPWVYIVVPLVLIVLIGFFLIKSNKTIGANTRSHGNENSSVFTIQGKE